MSPGTIEPKRCAPNDPMILWIIKIINWRNGFCPISRVDSLIFFIASLPAQKSSPQPCQSGLATDQLTWQEVISYTSLVAGCEDK